MKVSIQGVVMDKVLTKREGYNSIYLYQKGIPELIKVTQIPTSKTSEYEIGEEITISAYINTFQKDGKTIQYIKYDEKGG